jgi:threonine dehydrogenase-like Zn-dependent dehydrogenase
MRRAQWGEQGIRVVDADPGPLPSGWVRLRVAACGICGTDLHLWRRELPAPPDGIPGHEIAGIPIGSGAPAEGLCAVEPLTRCGTCDYCLSGRQQLCRQSRILGIGLPGGLAETVDVPAHALHPVPAGVSARVASLSEPLAVCVRAVHRAGLETASRVLVLGGGSIGLLAGLLARDRAAAVGVTVRHPHQREAARELGVEPLAEEEARAWARENAPDVVIETVGGTADTLNDAVRLCRAGGRVVVLGVFAGQRPVDALGLLLKEIELVGSNVYGTARSGSEFRAAVGLLPRYRAELERLQTHRFPLDRVADAFTAAADKKSGAIKVTVEPVLR